MRFFQEILAMALSKEDVHVVFPNLNLSLTTLVEMECYQALLQIKAIIEDDSLGDFECVEKLCACWRNSEATAAIDMTLVDFVKLIFPARGMGFTGPI